MMSVYDDDFNVTESVMNECSQLLYDFCSLNNLHLLLHGNDVHSHTYHCDGNGHVGILNYSMCSRYLTTTNNAVVILSDGHVSDHCVICVT